MSDPKLYEITLEQDGVLVHTHYDQYSVLRTIELILGLKPLSIYDADQRQPLLPLRPAGHRLPRDGVHAEPAAAIPLVRHTAPLMAYKRTPSDASLLARKVQVITSYRVPLLGSSSKDGSIVYIDSEFFKATKGGNLSAKRRSDGATVTYNVMKGLVTHEKVEFTMEKLGWSYTYSHREFATRLENKQYEDDGMDAASVQRAFDPWIKRLAQEKIPHDQIAPDMLELPAEHPHNVEQRRILAEENATENQPEPK